MHNFYKLVSDCESNNQSAALVIITSTSGSTPRKAGSKMLVYADGKIAGTIGGGALEQDVKQKALAALDSGQPLVYDHLLSSDHNMACGGKVQIYIEPIGQRYQLFIFGAGHIGHKLAEAANQLQFAVTLIDERAELCNEISNDAISVICKNHKDAFADLDFNKRTLVASISHLHEYDREIVAHCAKQEHAYLGMIGSKRKIVTAKKIFLEEGLLNEEEMDKIDWPMGIPISCQTPEEIVISILAKLIDVRGKLLGANK